MTAFPVLIKRFVQLILNLYMTSKNIFKLTDIQKAFLTRRGGSGTGWIHRGFTPMRYRASWGPPPWEAHSESVTLIYLLQCSFTCQRNRPEETCS